MTPHRRGRGVVRPLRAVILFFGESPYDGKALGELHTALCPGFRGKRKPLRNPLILRQGAQIRDAPKKAAQIVATIRAEGVRNDVRCVFVFHDADAVEPEDEVLERDLRTALQSAGWDCHALVAAWELEAWWFLWPDAAPALVPSWKRPDSYVGREVGLIHNAKEAYDRAVRPSQAGPRYMEAHGPSLAAKVRELGIARAPQAQSRSYARFLQMADECCERA